jgi:hypothetical protein
MRHRERLPDNDDPEVTALSRALNAIYGERARDASLFRNPNGVDLRLANFRLSIRCIRLKASAALSRDGYGTEEVWTEFDAGYPSFFGEAQPSSANHIAQDACCVILHTVGLALRAYRLSINCEISNHVASA